ncbi:MAG: PQQ-binding-like beta-propeller repeat protein [Verrucomicrobiota bacterium]
MFELQWQKDIGWPNVSSPTISNGNLILSSFSWNTGDPRGTLRALNAKTGAALWKDTTFLEAFAPTIYEGAIYFPGQPLDSGQLPYEQRASFYCYDLETGTELWETKMTRANTNWLGPCVADGYAWIEGGEREGDLTAINTSSGTKLYDTTIQDLYGSWSASYNDGTVYTCVKGIFRAHNPSTGGVLWSLDIGWGLDPRNQYNTISLNDHSAFVITTSDTGGSLVAIDLVNQIELWRVEDIFNYYSTPSISNGIVYAITDDGDVIAYEQNSGLELRRYQTNNRDIKSQPLITNNRLFVPTNYNTYVFNLNSTGLLQTIPNGTLGTVPYIDVGNLSFADGYLYFVDRDRVLQAWAVADPNNKKPNVADLSFDVPEEGKTTIALSASDADEDILTMVIDSLPEFGSLYQTDDGINPTKILSEIPARITHPENKLIYVAPPALTGSPLTQISYRATDGKMLSDSGIISVNVIPLNDPPLALSDSAFLPPGQELRNYFPTFNDYDEDLDTLTIISFTQPSHGRITQNDDGSLNYIPDENFVGEDSFNYTAADPSGEHSTATVSITVSVAHGRNWPTTGGNNSRNGYYPSSQASADFTLLWEFNAPLEPHETIIGDKVAYITNATSITAVNAYTGAILWDNFNEEQNELNPPAYSEGKLFLQIQDSDPTFNHLVCMDATNGKTIWTSPYEDQHFSEYYSPSIVGDTVYVNGGKHGGLYAFNAFTGAEIFHNESLPQETQSTPTYYNGRLFTFGRNGIFDVLEFQEHSPENDSTIWTERLYPLNRTGPSKLVPCQDSSAFLMAQIPIESGYTHSVLCIDLENKTIKWAQPTDQNSLHGHISSAHGLVFAISGSSVYAYGATQGNLIKSYDAEGEYLDHRIIVSNNLLFASSSTQTYVFDLYTTNLLKTLPIGGMLTMADDILYISSETEDKVQAWSIVDDANQTPIAHANQFFGVEDTPLAIQLSGSDTEEISYIINSLPDSGQLFQTHDGTTLSLPIDRAPAQLANSQGKLIYIPEPDSFGLGIGNFEFKVSDGNSFSSSKQIIVDIEAVNDAPVAVNDQGLTRPGQNLELRLTSNDIDIDDSELTIVSFSQPEFGVVNDNGDGSLIYIPPSDLDTGSTSFEYTVSDSGGFTSSATVNLSIDSQEGTSWETYGKSNARQSYVSLNLNDSLFSFNWSTSHFSPHQVAVKDGLAYVTSEVGYHLTCLDAENGTTVWQRGGGSDASSGPAISNGLVYYMDHNKTFNNDTGVISHYNTFYCYDRITGVKKWSLLTYTDSARSYLAPVIVNNNLYAAAKFGYPGAVIGIDALTGEYFFGDYESSDSNWAPSSDGDSLYTHTGNSFKKLIPLENRVEWTIKLNPPYASRDKYRSIVLDGDKAFFVQDISSSSLSSAKRNLRCHDTNSGGLIWLKQDRYRGTPAINQGEIFVINGSRIESMKTWNGKVIRVYETHDENLVFQPIVTNDLILIASTTNTYIFDRNTSHLRQTLPIGGYLSLTKEYLFVSSFRELSCYKISQGLVFTPEGGTESESYLDVVISGYNESTSIYYSTDGSLPTSESPSITSGDAIRIFQTSTILAYADLGEHNSAVHEASYSIRDSNTNSIPDWWEELHFGQSISVVGNYDSDGDRKSDYQEWMDGTDPLDKNDFFSITFESDQITQGSFKVEWDAIADRYYCVEYSSDLNQWDSATPWTKGHDGPMEFTDNFDASAIQRRFYRVAVRP